MTPDLTGIEVVDNHCHAILSDQAGLDLGDWRGFFTESSGPRSRQHHVAHTAAFRRITTDFADWLDAFPDETDVFRARQTFDSHSLSRDLLSSAGIRHLLIDDGFPPPPTFDLTEHSEFVSGYAYRIVRIEPLIERLIEEATDIDDLVVAVQAHIRSAVTDGAVGLKSAIAYRTGLDIRRWAISQAQAGLEEVKRARMPDGTHRLHNSPLHDTLVHACLEVCTELELPIQFHVGYGDRDVDMRTARPEHLRAVIEDPNYRDAQIVLLHECYPFTAVGAWLASVYDNVWLDLSYGVPFLSRSEMLSFTRQALGVAPWSKLLYSSDGFKIPEMHWASAKHGREVIAAALGELVVDGDLSPSRVEDVAALILWKNAVHLYGLP